MKKRTRCLLAASLAVCLILSVCVCLMTFAADSSGSCGEKVTYKLSNGTLTVSGTGAMNSYSENGVPWAPARSRITKVVVETGVTSVGYYAFADCPSLTSVTLAATVTDIGRFAFANCEKLNGVVLPDGLKTLGSHAFLNCKALTAITVPEGVKVLSPSVFDGCSALADVTLPSGLKTVGASAFEDCSSLVSLRIPDNTESVGAYAFENCVSLTALRVHASVASLGEKVFNGCSSSLVVTCPKGSATDLYCNDANITVRHEGLSEGGSDPEPGEWSPWF